MYKIIPIDDNSWAFEDVMPDGDTVRFFLLSGSEKAAVVDSGYLDIDVKKLAENVLSENNKLLKNNGEVKDILLLNTHGDFDHTGGNASFESFYMTEKDYEVNNIKDRCPDSKLMPINDGERIDLGERELLVIYVPGHTYGNVAYLDVTNKILFPGDIIQTNNMFMFGSHRCPEKLLSSLTKLSKMKDSFVKVYACHGQMVLESSAVDEVMNSWKLRLEGSIKPERIEVFGQPVDAYHMPFCTFLCEP